MNSCIFAGTFNPFHEGHKSIVNKAISLFDKVYVVVANNPEKIGSNLDARFNHVRAYYQGNKNVEVKKLEQGLLADFAKELGVKYLVRSARDAKDFEYELLLAKGYKSTDKELEVIIFMPDLENIKVRSSLFPKDGK